jgi:hypothetical protein
MPLDGAGTEEERLRHVAVAVATRHELKNLRFARGQPFSMQQVARLVVSPPVVALTWHWTRARLLHAQAGRRHDPRTSFRKERQRLFAARHTRARGGQRGGEFALSCRQPGRRWVAGYGRAIRSEHPRPRIQMINRGGRL